VETRASVVRLPSATRYTLSIPYRHNVAESEEGGGVLAPGNGGKAVGELTA